jgi:hypothetical protein
MLPLMEKTVTSVVEKRHFLKRYFQCCSRSVKAIELGTRFSNRGIPVRIDVCQRLC